MRKTFIAGNWKMNKTISEAIELANGLKRKIFDIDESMLDIAICPPFTSLSEVAAVVGGSQIALGAQDSYWLDQGAFTGEISPRMLKDAGCQYVIVGHSERRQFFSETNEFVSRKAKAILAGKLIPIVCVGETLTERQNNATLAVLADHIHNSLKGITPEEIIGVVIAYEPVWAIGTGKTATSLQAEEAHKYIRELLVKDYGKAPAESVRILYGGSVKPENIVELLNQPDVDGALVGGASLTEEAFSSIIINASKVRK